MPMVKFYKCMIYNLNKRKKKPYRYTNTYVHTENMYYICFNKKHTTYQCVNDRDELIFCPFVKYLYTIMSTKYIYTAFWHAIA